MLFVSLCIFVPLHGQKSLNILFVVQQYPAMDTFVINQAQGLLQNGHELSILALNKKGEAQPQELGAGTIKDVFYGQAVPQGLSYDIIHCQFLPLARIGMQLLLTQPKAKLVVSVRGGSDNLLGVDTQETRRFHALMQKKTDLLLPVCDLFKKQLIALGYAQKKIKVLHSPIDCTKFNYCERIAPESGSVQLVSVGHLIERKGFEYALQAVAQLLPAYPQLRYTIIGDGPLDKTLKTLIKQLGLEAVVSLTGRKNPQEIVDFLKTAHIFLMPSITVDGYGEGIPNALKEAMATGMPVIATAHCGIPELIEDGVSGFLVPEHNSQALAHRIAYLVDHPACWSAMSNASRAKIECEHELFKENQKLNEFIGNLINKNGQP